MSEISVLPIELLRRRDDARQLNDGVVAALADSIAEIGLINPLRVRAVGGGFYEVIAGSHRFAACDATELTAIPCIIVGDDDLRAELAMIDENLMRAELSPSERAQQTARRKTIYEDLHPEAKHGATLGNAQVAKLATRENDQSPAPSFAQSTAAATGQSERAVRRDAERGEKVIDAAIEVIRGTKLDTGSYLDKLKKLSPSEQVIAAKRDLAWEKKRAEDPRPAGGIAAQIQTKTRPTYDQVRAAILLLADLSADDLNSICPPNKHAAMYQKLAHLEEVFAAARGGAE